jgi:nitrite reductase/ring-hydroxylating ferredoxin subunit/multimeric flavodoxin WrbA
MSANEWHNLGSAEPFQQPGVREARIGGTPVAISHHEGKFGVVSGVCNHAGGPLGQGRVEGDYLVCPWHNWKFHRCTGKGEPGFEDDCLPSYECKVENGELWVRTTPVSKRNKKPHERHPLARPVERTPGPARVACISTTAMDEANPRYSTSDALLEVALRHAAEHGHETRMIRLSELKFRNCEGYYSKSAKACTWPCSITQMDPNDQLDKVYEALVHWADVIVVATPIRWGSASSLYFKMAERLNCIQNQVTIRDNVLIKNKVVSFIITGGQDNIQAVAGQMLGFFAELGFAFPQFPYIAHSRGWTAEDMEKNVAEVKNSKELHEGAMELVDRSIALADILIARPAAEAQPCRAGRKAHRLDVELAVLKG